MDVDEKELQVKVCRICLYVPVIDLLFRWLGYPQPATMLENYCDITGTQPPKLAHGTINKCANSRPTASKKSQDKFNSWAGKVYGEDLKEFFTSPLITNPGHPTTGAASWVPNLMLHKEYLDSEFPYTLTIIGNLISAEKLILEEVLERNITPEERTQYIYKHPPGGLSYEGLDLQLRKSPTNDPIAHLDGRSVSLLTATYFIYLMAAWDVEYSQLVIPELASKGNLCTIIPQQYSRKVLHTAFWEKLKLHAVRQGSITGTWNEVASKLNCGSDPDIARRTLNRYKAGLHEIESESLLFLIDGLFGYKSEILHELYYLRLRGTWFITRMFDDIKKLTPNLREGDFDLLTAKYHTFYEYHLEALEELSPKDL